MDDCFVFLLPDNDDIEAWRWLHNNKMGQLLVQNPQSGTHLNEKWKCVHLHIFKLI